eukprot:scaffold1051_cov119-Cylindrotheca_fusiformis.AAC.26
MISSDLEKPRGTDPAAVLNFEWNSRIHAPSRLRKVIKHTNVRTTAGILAIVLSEASLEDEDDSSLIWMSIRDTFHHFAKRQIMWDALEVRVEYVGGRLTRTLIKSILNLANDLNLFKRIAVQEDECSDDDRVETTSLEHPFFNLVAPQSERLEALELSAPCQMTRRDSYGLCQLLEHTQRLRDLTYTLNSEFQVATFSNSLRSNTTLEKLTLILGSYKLPDIALADVIKSAMSPSLHELVIESGDCFGHHSSKQLQSLLSAPNSCLKTLKVYGYASRSSSSFEARARTEDVFEGLRQNQSLEHIVLSSAIFAEGISFSTLFKTSVANPSLRKLCLWEGINFTQEDLNEVIQMDRLERPIEINLHNLSPLRFLCKQNNKNILAQVLETHPELRLSIGPAYHFETTLLQHACDRNWYGRYLLYQPSKTPLSLWPNALEQSNDKPSQSCDCGFKDDQNLSHSRATIKPPFEKEIKISSKVLLRGSLFLGKNNARRLTRRFQTFLTDPTSTHDCPCSSTSNHDESYRLESFNIQ